jgi:hypothetical protein
MTDIATECVPTADIMMKQLHGAVFDVLYNSLIRFAYTDINL